MGLQRVGYDWAIFTFGKRIWKSSIGMWCTWGIITFLLHVEISYYYLYTEILIIACIYTASNSVQSTILSFDHCDFWMNWVIIIVPVLKVRKQIQWECQSLSRVRLFATPWTVATRLLCPQDSPGKNTGVSCHFLLQGIFPTQDLNPPGRLSTTEPPGKLLG